MLRTTCPLLALWLLVAALSGCAGDEFSEGNTATPAGGTGGSTGGDSGGTDAGGTGGGQAGGGAGDAGGAPGQGGAGGTAGEGGTEAGSGSGGSTGGTGAGEGGAAGSANGGAAGAAGAEQGGGAGEAAGEPGSSGSAGTAGSAGTSGAGGASGAAGDAGTSGTAGTAGAGGAPECEGDLGGCFDGAQPRLCIDGKWEDAGGPCNFGCSTGKCACSAPDRFSFFYDGIPLPGPTAVISDKKLGKKWWISEVATFDQAKLKCAANNLRLPTLSEAKSLVAQQPDAIQCSQTKNLDKTFVDAAKEYATVTSLDTPIWTSDLDNTGMVLIVQLTSGQVSTRDPAEKAPSTLFCIEKGAGAAGAAGAAGGAGGAGAAGSSGGGVGGAGGEAACQVGPAFDFDQDNGGFVISGANPSWAWGAPLGSSAPQGDHTNGAGKLWGTNVTGNSNFCENSALESGDIDLTAYTGQSVTLEAWSWLDLRECDASASPTCTVLGTTVCKYDAQSGGTSYSGGVLQVFNGVGWDTVVPQGGYQSGTMKIECHSLSTPPPPSNPVEVCSSCDLDGQTGFTANTPQKAWVKTTWDVSTYASAPFRVRFRFASYFDDPCWVNSGGWYVDDIRFTTACP